MERMEHIRGRLLDLEGQTLLEGLDGYLGFHARSNGTKSYYGYFELPADTAKSKNISNASSYKLVLDDGRAGNIYADVHPGNAPGKLMAEFHVSGAFGKSK